MSISQSALATRLSSGCASGNWFKASATTPVPMVAVNQFGVNCRMTRGTRAAGNPRTANAPTLSIFPMMSELLTATGPPDAGSAAPNAAATFEGEDRSGPFIGPMD